MSDIALGKHRDISFEEPYGEVLGRLRHISFEELCSMSFEEFLCGDLLGKLDDISFDELGGVHRPREALQHQLRGALLDKAGEALPPQVRDGSRPAKARS